MLFVGFLSLVIALVSSFYSYFFLFLFLPILLFLIIRKKSKSYYILAISGLLLGIILLLLPVGSTGSKGLTGLCVYRKDSYLFLWTIEGKYLVYDDNQIPLFSIAKITGESQKALFSHYESGFRFQDYLATQGVFYKIDADSISLIFDSHYRLDFLKTYSFSYLNEDSRLIADSLLFSNSLYDLKENAFLQDLGLTSAFAVTGFHLSFFLSILRKLFGKKLKKSYDYLELTFVAIFLFLSSFKYAIKRIFLTKLAYKINKETGSKLDSLNILSLVAIIMLILEPYTLFSASFYYSFPFLFFLRIFQPRFKNKRSSFFLLLLVFYLPIRMVSSPTFYILSPLSQILLLPMSHLIFLLALPLLLIPQIGIILNGLISLYLKLIRLVHTNSPFLINGKVSIIVSIVLYIPLLLFFIMRTYNYKRQAKVVAFTSVALASLIFLPDFSSHTDITFIDVGQGDATLVRYKKTDILIDTGGSMSVDLATECLIPYFYSLKMTDLEAVIITHLDIDHYGALEKLNENYPIENIYYANDFLKQRNNTMTIGDIKVTNLNDFHISNESNDNSGVYYFDIEDTSILIMGDAPKEVENAIIERNPSLDVDIIKLGHHGSSTSSGSNFLRAISPSLAIISCGYDNIYNHPSLETLTTLRTLKIPYRRTDLEGTITIKL